MIAEFNICFEIVTTLIKMNIQKNCLIRFYSYKMTKNKDRPLKATF